MAITKLNPHTIHLSGPCVLVNDLVAGVQATPGMLAEMFDVSGENRWRPNASATEYTALAVFLDFPEYNKGIDDVYAIGDLAKVAFLCPGSVFYALVPSGQNISNGELLQSNGDGKLKSATATTADANLGRFQALDNIGAVTADTRCRVQVIG
jgi:hypothetical protein